MRRAGSDDPDAVLALLRRTADAIVAALGTATDWGPSGNRTGQYRSDVVADAAAHAVLDAEGIGVLSEESGLRLPDSEVAVVAVVDPLDGSTNAFRGVPWYATSLCAVDNAGPLAAVVRDLPHAVSFEAVRGGGARRDGDPITPSDCRRLDGAVVALSGWPPRHLGWSQYRALGAAALDLCAVASGVVDGYVDCSVDAHGPWDYLGGLLVATEAGAVVGEAFDRPLVVIDADARRTPVAAATAELYDALVDARRSFP
jgi:fructose-1,6-bisphosphatase/inositol monophosphatase family enzyme